MEVCASIERGSVYLSVCASRCCLSTRWAVNACPGNSVSVKEKSWGAGSELLAGGLCWAGCAVCFCSKADRLTENGEGEEQGERSRVDENHCLSKNACPQLWNSPFRKQEDCIFSFPSPYCSLGINPELAIVEGVHCVLSRAARWGSHSDILFLRR